MSVTWYDGAPHPSWVATFYYEKGTVSYHCYLLELDMMEKNGGIILPHVYNSNVSQPMGCQQRSQKCCWTINVIKRSQKLFPNAFSKAPELSPPQKCIKMPGLNQISS